MHPAYSVIIFTTASGAGYGLLFLLGILGLSEFAAEVRWFYLVALTIALGLVTVGLLSSTFHLGHPERAWRAFSQWRSSWLSREGVASIVTYMPAGLLWLLLLFDGGSRGALLWLGLASALLAVVTVSFTGMIYASLTTIRQWHNAWVVPAYLALAVASGAVLLICITAMFGSVPARFSFWTIGALMVAFVVKLGYWRSIDSEAKTHTMEQATGLGHLGKVRQIAAPHTSVNYVMKEMGFRVARKHAQKLRRLAVVFGFAVPALTVLAAVYAGHSLAVMCGLIAVVSCAIGLVIERWLFFGEAQHVVTLYYGEAKA